MTVADRVSRPAAEATVFDYCAKYVVDSASDPLRKQLLARLRGEVPHPKVSILIPAYNVQDFVRELPL